MNEEGEYYEHQSVASELTLSVPSSPLAKKRAQIAERLNESPLKRDPSIGSVSPKRKMDKVTYNIVHNHESRKAQIHSAHQSVLATAPKWDSNEELEKRRSIREQRVINERCKTAKLSDKRVKQREKILVGLELQREQMLAEQDLYKKQKREQWKKKLTNSPFGVDLVADKERIQEENEVRRRAEERRKIEEQKKLTMLKNNLILNQLLEGQRKENAVKVNEYVRRRKESEENRVNRTKEKIQSVDALIENKKREKHAHELDMLHKADRQIYNESFREGIM